MRFVRPLSLFQVNNRARWMCVRVFLANESERIAVFEAERLCFHTYIGNAAFIAFVACAIQ